MTPSRTESAEDCFRAADVWFLVRDETAIPLWSLLAPEPRPGNVLLAAGPPAGAAAAFTLRELESAPWRFAGGTPRPAPEACALAFRTADFRALPGETVGDFANRLFRETERIAADPGFSVAWMPERSFSNRRELEGYLPAEARPIFDAGRGPEGASSLEARLSRLKSEEKTCGGFLFEDVLQRVPDPVGILEAARGVAGPGASLVASVGNAGYLSIARDLLLGRFDPVAAGPADAGYLRWFTRESLAGTLAEAGWNVSLIEAVPAAPAAREEEFLAWACLGSRVEREALRTYEWIAVAARDSA